MVPIAPSSTRMRSLIASTTASRTLGGDAVTSIDSGSGCLFHRRPQAQQVADRIDKVGAVHGVKMEIGDAAIDQIEHLLGGDGGGDQLARCRIGVEAVEASG